MGVLKVKDATGAWVPIGVGIDPVNPIETFNGTHTGGNFSNAGLTTVATLNIPARGWKRVYVLSGFELCSWSLVASGQYEIVPYFNGTSSYLNLRGMPGTAVVIPNCWGAIAAGATVAIEIKATMIDAATRAMVAGFCSATAFPTP